MKILWVSNSPIGPSARILGESYAGTSGGWIASEFEKLKKDDNEFYFLCSSRKVKAGQVVKKKEGSSCVYCVNSPRLCYGIKNPPYLVKEIENVINDIDPDVIHIWGTETCISNIVANVKTRCKKVVFLQGLIGVHQRYLGGGLCVSDHAAKPTLVERIKEAIRRKHFAVQARIERDTLKKCGYAIADGTCAKAYINSIGGDIKIIDYKLLPGKVFYERKWSYADCEKESLFTVFSANAEKGLDKLIKALAIVKSDYPNVKLRVPGGYAVDKNGKLIPRTYYERVIAELIVNNGLSENVEFLGKLSPEQMAECLQKANCFVNPSVMENHALSLREALVVGVPCISSVCGSVMDFLEDGKNGLLYRFEEYEVLAERIERVFKTEGGFSATDYFNNDDTLSSVYLTLL